MQDRVEEQPQALQSCSQSCQNQVRNHIHSQDCMLAKDELLLMMIKQEVSVTNYCKHVSQSLIPSELPPGVVMGNKMEKESKLLNSFGEKWSNQLPGDASSKQDPSWSRAAPLLCSAQAQWPKSCWTSPTTAWLCPAVSAVPIPFTFYPGTGTEPGPTDFHLCCSND